MEAKRTESISSNHFFANEKCKMSGEKFSNLIGQKGKSAYDRDEWGNNTKDRKGGGMRKEPRCERFRGQIDNLIQNRCKLLGCKAEGR